MEDEIAAIWSSYYTMTERDKTFLRIPIRSQFHGLYYGIYCGPVTNQKFDYYYKQNNSHAGDPIDGLDFICLLHDRYHTKPKGNKMMLDSIRVFSEYGMIKNSFSPYAAERLIKFLHKVFVPYTNYFILVKGQNKN